MKLTIGCVGKLKEAAYRSLADEYLGRIRRFTRVEEIEVRDAGDLARVVPSGASLVALEVWGQQLSSEQFASQLERWGMQAKGDVCFLIGAADGIPRALSERAESHLSLSRMTLPHRLARVVLLEQIYRGFSILRGEPYAREG